MLVNFFQTTTFPSNWLKSSADGKIISGSSVLVDDNNMLSRLLENVLDAILIKTL